MEINFTPYRNDIIQAQDLPLGTVVQWKSDTKQEQFEIILDKESGIKRFFNKERNVVYGPIYGGTDVFIIISSPEKLISNTTIKYSDIYFKCPYPQKTYTTRYAVFADGSIGYVNQYQSDTTETSSFRGWLEIIKDVK